MEMDYDINWKYEKRAFGAAFIILACILIYSFRPEGKPGVIEGYVVGRGIDVEGVCLVDAKTFVLVKHEDELFIVYPEPAFSELFTPESLPMGAHFPGHSMKYIYRRVGLAYLK